VWSSRIGRVDKSGKGVGILGKLEVRREVRG
jgi:hypothetical protein